MPLSKQEIFETVYNGLLAQGFRQSGGLVGEDFVCLYRDGNGCKCAAGHLIPDDRYNPRMENIGENSFVRVHKKFDLGDLVAKEDAVFVARLQAGHDRNADPESMQRALIWIAIQDGRIEVSDELIQVAGDEQDINSKFYLPNEI